jgi:hypothetical protein
VLLGQHEEFCTLTVAADDAFFHQALCEFFDGALGFVSTHNFKANKIAKFNFNGHRATAAKAAIAHSFTIEFPS